MEFLTKFIVFAVLVAGTCGRFIVHKRSLPNSTAEELENASQEETISIITDENTSQEENASNSTDVAETECNCNLRYFKHYEAKGCFVDQVDSCGCPKKFSCPQNQTLSEGCVYQNQEYPVGSRIATTNVCQMCRCRQGEPPFMSCSFVECFSDLDPGPGENCHMVYAENRCCPVGFKCLESEFEDEREIENSETCEYNGILYPFGSKIYPDICQVCICNENWNGVDNSSCFQRDCISGRLKAAFDAGCIPVYHEKICCPIEFYCPSNHNFSYSWMSSNKTEYNEISSDDKCSFGDQLYDVGSNITTDNPCVTCSCLVPPDFTCIHRSCPKSPNEEDCYAVYSPTECCPSYDCLMGDAHPESDAEGCPTPLCADSSCRIETPPGHACPTCVCGERVSELEHNDLQQQQQQVQQISQNLEPIYEMYQGPVGIANDYSEDELQMMPIRMQDAEGQFSDMERVILPDFEDMERSPEEEEIREFDDSFNENDSQVEKTATASEEYLENIEQNMISGKDESELDDDSFETNSNGIEKEVQKRSNITDVPNAGHLEIDDPIEQQESVAQSVIETEDIEREGGYPESNGEFDDELESFKNRLFAKNDTIINEIISIDHVVEVPVPDGCPTPMCEGPWCKVGIPEGHKCPTCICKRQIDGEP